MSQHGLRQFLHRCRIGLDLLSTLLLLMLLTVWATRYLLAGQPVVGQIEQLFGTDKTMHLLLGFFLPLCVGWLLRLYRRRLINQAAGFVMVASAYAADEWFQSMLSYRSASMDDFLMSMTGWSLSVAVWFSLLGLTARIFRDGYHAEKG